MTMEPYKSLLKYVPKEGLILDAGCGNFAHANFLKNDNRRIICTDIVNCDMDEARNNTFLLASVEDLSFKDNSFDFIYCLSVLELIEDDISVIDEFYRILKPKGKLLFTVPTARSIFRFLRDLELACGAYQFPQFNVKHYHYYTKKDIQRLIANKFKLIDLYGYAYNFVLRLRNFLVTILKRYVSNDILKAIKSKKLVSRSYYAKSGREILNGPVSIESSNLLEVLQRRFKFIADFSYHYIVVVEKT